MLATTHPSLLLGEPLAAAPAKEKVVTSPQNTGGDEGDGSGGGGGGGSNTGGGAEGGHPVAGTEASIVKEKSDLLCCGLYTTWQVLVPVKVSVTERLCSSGVRDVADDGVCG